MSFTRQDVQEYIKQLDVEAKLTNPDGSPIPKLYRDIENSYLLVVEDSSSDDFQIVCELRDVFWKYAKRRIEGSGQS